MAAVRATREANANRFRPARAVVTDSTASFHWSVTDGSFQWNLPENMAFPDFGWEATFTADGGEYEVMADVNHRPGSAPASGDLAALVRAAATNLHQIVSADSAVPHRTLNRATVRVELEPGGMRLVLRDPRLASALRRERPATVRMEFRPCDGTCAQTQVPVTYP